VVGSGAVGSVDVSEGGGGEDGSVPVPIGTVWFVSTRVFVADEPLSRFARIARAAPSAAMISAPMTGQTQSPGYHGTRRRHAVASTGMSPAVTGRRRPHSRQYSWYGS
jgi:hypothetical protein